MDTGMCGKLGQTGPDPSGYIYAAGSFNIIQQGFFTYIQRVLPQHIRTAAVQLFLERDTKLPNVCK
jgi:hypothetical protein